MSVADLVCHYESIETPFYFTPPSSPTLQTKGTESPLQLHSKTMFAHRRHMSHQSSIDTDSGSTSPLTASFESPDSLYSSPDLASSTESKFEDAASSRRGKPQQPFSMARMHSAIKAPSSGRKQARPWYTRRALSQTDMALELELRAGGIEGLGLDLFEPRPRATVVSRNSSHGSIVLDGIFQVLENAH